MKITTFKEYIEFTRTTAVYPKEKELEYLVFGVFDEIDELLDKIRGYSTPDERLDELGDICWYMARLFDCLEVDATYLLAIRQTYDWGTVPNRIPNKSLTQKVVWLFSYMSKFCGFLKKYIRDGNDSKMDLAKEQLTILYDAVHVLPSYIKQGESLQTVLQRNVDKLSDRKDRGVLKGDGDNR